MDSTRKKKLIWQLPFLTLLIVGTVFIIRQQRSIPYQHSQGFIFGTTYSITYQYDEDLKTEIEDKLKQVDASTRATASFPTRRRDACSSMSSSWA